MRVVRVLPGRLRSVAPRFYVRVVTALRPEVVPPGYAGLTGSSGRPSMLGARETDVARRSGGRMPGITVRATLARATLKDWQRRGCAPFDVGARLQPPGGRTSPVEV